MVRRPTLRVTYWKKISYCSGEKSGYFTECSALGVAELLPVSCGGLGACGCGWCVLPPGGDALCAAALPWDEGGREVVGSLCSVTQALSSSPQGTKAAPAALAEW